MRKLNKKGIELQVNFVVILILTLIIFGSSIMIAYKVMKSTNKLKDQVDATTQQRLEALLVSGNEAVVIPFNKKDDLRKGESAVFGVGIVNMLGVNTEFKINIAQAAKSYDKDGIEQPPGDWVYMSETKTGEIKNNAYKIESIVFIPKNVKIGNTYVFNVDVCSGSSCTPYPTAGSTKKIRITVIQ